MTNEERAIFSPPLFCVHGFSIGSYCLDCVQEKVNHPKHYNSSEIKCECGRQIECIDVTRTMDFNLGNAVKYLWRYNHKGGLEDIKKARWYLEDYIKNKEKK